MQESGGKELVDFGGILVSAGGTLVSVGGMRPRWVS